MLATLFRHDTMPHRVEITFSEAVTPAGASAALGLALRGTPASTGGAVPSTPTPRFVSGPGNVATWTFATGTGVLPDGRYRATLPAGSVTDAAGNPLAADATFDFFVLTGDADRDGVVAYPDLLALAKNYGRSGKTWADGDFTLDGKVDFADLLALAKNYSTDLTDAALPAAAPPVLHQDLSRAEAAAAAD